MVGICCCVWPRRGLRERIDDLIWNVILFIFRAFRVALTVVSFRLAENLRNPDTFKKVNHQWHRWQIMIIRRFIKIEEVIVCPKVKRKMKEVIKNVEKI